MAGWGSLSAAVTPNHCNTRGEPCKLSVARSEWCAWAGRRSHGIEVKAIKEGSSGGLTGTFADDVAAGAGRGCPRVEVQIGAGNIAAPRIVRIVALRRACVAQADRRRRGFALSQRSNVRMPSLDTALPGVHKHIKILLRRSRGNAAAERDSTSR